ncbi:hypothetical protein PTW35_09085 [Photobacterium sp. DA100]|uniref:hypothetical protein n=1 Tax=Photobacterium sp. DA100 TaxID=3027472 RepID=UPI00247993CE|nr:hypothetical protein [Photobacterium sp. DA100]WEM40806.1 hypothetical protein PTW35_09085 [Photobacterium sp. DA100]
MKTLTSVTWEARKIMAAEKLTKGRLIQILFLLAVLITAFVWRTVTYNNNQAEDDTALTCQLSAKLCHQNDSGESLNISLAPYPAVANQELTIQIDNTNVKPTASVEGVNMYMGIIPVTFEQTSEGWLGRFTVPECMHDEMEWAVVIEQGNRKITATFVVKKQAE